MVFVKKTGLMDVNAGKVMEEKSHLHLKYAKARTPFRGFLLSEGVNNPYDFVS